MVELNVTDVNGLSAQCTAQVLVSDAEPPSVTCPSDVYLNTYMGECDAVVTYGAADAADNCDVVSVLAEPANGTAFGVGTFVVTGMSDASRARAG